MAKRKVLLRQILKYTVFAVIVFLLYILQSTPGFLSVFGLKPVFIIPFCVSLCILDDQWPVGIILIAGGLWGIISISQGGGLFHHSAGDILFNLHCGSKVFLKGYKKKCFLCFFCSHVYYAYSRLFVHISDARIHTRIRPISPKCSFNKCI